MRYRLALGLAVVLAACSGGGSSGPSVPSLPWGNFRHDASNSAVGGLINQNLGNVTLLIDAAHPPVGVTLSTPTIDRNNNLVLGTANGVMSVGPDGGTRWTFDGFETTTPSGTQTGCAVCNPDLGGPCMKVGSVSSSPTVTPGDAIVFGTDATDGQPGALFVIQQHGTAIDCVWFFKPDDGSAGSISSSAITLIYPLDLSLLTVYSAGDDGVLHALNNDGSLRWSFPTAHCSLTTSQACSPCPPGETCVAAGSGGHCSIATSQNCGVPCPDDEPCVGPITSTPALGPTNIFVATPDGLVSAIDFSGQLRTNGQVSVGAPPAEPPFQPSLIVGPSVYAIGSRGTLFALNFGSQTPTMKWQFSAQDPITKIQRPIRGSPAILTQSFGFMATTASDTIVYVVDTQNTAYGVRDLTGDLFQPQLCSEDMTQDCRTDSCNPTGAQPPVDTCIASTHRCMVSGQTCTQDSCVVNNEGICTVADGFVSLVDAPATISASPIVSDDPFVVVGTSDGRVCARSTANRVPGQNFTSPTATWRGGHCSGTTTQTCVVDQDCPPSETCAPPGGHCGTDGSHICFPCPPDEVCVAAGSGGHCSVTTLQICGAPCASDETCMLPGGHCSVTTSQTCTVDSDCPEEHETCVAAGPHCSVTTSQPCAQDNNCTPDETCVFHGCITLDPTTSLPVKSSPIIGENARIYVTTDAGLYEIK